MKKATVQLNTDVMRSYGSTSVVGIVVGGAIKNVVMITTSLSDDLEYDLNTCVALVTCDLAEITHLTITMNV